MIALDGKRLPGTDYKIDANFLLPSSDDSGTGSFGFSSDTGNKPKILTLKCIIAFDDNNDLQSIIDLASSVDENGARKEYTVTNDLATQYRIRRAKFDTEIKATEDTQGLKAWHVSFKLKEVQTVPEAKQQQIDNTAQDNSQSATTDAHENIQQQFDKVDGP